jgi:hypothetical protein
MIKMLNIERESDTGNILVQDLGKFNPDEFETYEIAFMNLLAQMYRSNKESLKYVVHPSSVPFAFTNEAKRHSYVPVTLDR